MVSGYSDIFFEGVFEASLVVSVDWLVASVKQVIKRTCYKMRIYKSNGSDYEK